MYVCMYVYIYIYIHVYTYIYIYICILERDPFRAGVRARITQAATRRVTDGRFNIDIIL